MAVEPSHEEHVEVEAAGPSAVLTRGSVLLAEAHVGLVLVATVMVRVRDRIAERRIRRVSALGGGKADRRRRPGREGLRGTRRGGLHHPNAVSETVDKPDVPGLGVNLDAHDARGASVDPPCLAPCALLQGDNVPGVVLRDIQKILVDCDAGRGRNLRPCGVLLEAVVDRVLERRLRGGEQEEFAALVDAGVVVEAASGPVHGDDAVVARVRDVHSVGGRIHDDVPGNARAALDGHLVVAAHVCEGVVEDADAVGLLEVVPEQRELVGRVLGARGLETGADDPVDVAPGRLGLGVVSDPNAHGALVQHVNVRHKARLDLGAADGSVTGHTVLVSARLTVSLEEQAVRGVVERGAHEEVWQVLEVVVVL